MPATLPNPDQNASLRFERREDDRWPINGIATVFRLGGPQFGKMSELRTLEYSASGLFAVSRDPIAVGSALSIGFSTPGYIAKRGTVIRCTSCSDGYRIAIAFDARLAA